MSKKQITITITFKIHQQDEEKEISCEKNKAISEYRNEVSSDKKYKNYIFVTKNNTYIDEKTLCKNIKDCVYLMPDSLVPIKINIYDEDDRIIPKTIAFKLSSTVSDLKQKLKEKLKSMFTFDKIKIKIENEKLKDDDYIFSHKKEGDLVVDVTGCKKISKENEKFYFQFPDGKICGLEFDSDTNFNDINEMKEFKEQDFSFFFEDSEINKKSKISEYEAKDESTPIQLKINYFIKVKYEGSKADPQEDHHPFASDQKVSNILDEYAKVVPERRKMEYEEVEYNEDTQISEIKYKKGNPLNITILPAEYSFQFEDSKESFKLALNGDMKVKKLIRKIQKEKEIQSDLEIYTGSKVDQKKHEEDETMSNFSESQKIIIKKVDPQYEITFKDKKGYKRLDVDWTVKDLLLSDNKYKTTDERKKVVVKHKDEILSEDILLCELRPRNISIEILDPIYQFQLDGSDPIQISISDDTEYNDAIEMVKEKFDELKEIEVERIEFQLKDTDFSKTNFGPEIPQEEPIHIIILDPEYTWTVKENEEDKGKNEDFKFPTNYKIKNAVKAIEKKLKYKFSIKIFQKTKSKFTQVEDGTNIYKTFYNKFIDVFVQKCPIRFSFTANNKDFAKEFANNEEIGQISKNLRLKKSALAFSESGSDDELNDRLEFEYKGNKFNSSDTFDALNYQPYEEEKIQINLLPPKYSVFSLKDSHRYQAENTKIKTTEIKIPEEEKEQIVIYQNFTELTDDEISFDKYSNIDYFTYETKVDFKLKNKKYSIYINDENITIDEIKALVAAQINEKSKNTEIDPKEISLIYMKKEFNKELFKGINYENMTIGKIKAKAAAQLTKEFGKPAIDPEEINFIYMKEEINKNLIKGIDFEEMTINEIKKLVAKQLAEELCYPTIGPERISLKYNKKEINEEFFKDIGYENGKSIEAIIKSKSINVDINKKLKEIEIDDDTTVANLQEKIGLESRFVLKINNKELKLDQKIKELHLSKKESIKVEIIKTKILTYKSQEFELDSLNLDDEKELKRHFQNVFEINVDNSKFIYNKEELQLKDFCHLSEGANVIVKENSREKKFKQFEDDEYNGKFYTNDTIKKVRDYIKEKDDDKSSIRIISNDKILFDRVKLFQVEGKIEIKKVKEVSLKKTLNLPNKTKITEYFDQEADGSQLTQFVKSYYFNEFDLFCDGNKIEDDDILFEIGDDISIIESAGKEGSKKKVTFKFSEGDDKDIIYSENKELSYYTKKLKGTGKFNTFFEKGKLISNDKLIDEDSQTIYAFNDSLKEDEDNLYNASAKCVQRVDRPKVTIKEILVDDLTKLASDDRYEGQIKIDYNPGIKTVFDLRKIVAEKLGFKKTDEIDLISLFILFTTKRGTDPALLIDTEQIAEILSEGPKQHILYLIVKGKKEATRGNLRNYAKRAKDLGLALTTDDIQNINARCNGDLDIVISTLEYMSSKKD